MPVNVIFYAPKENVLPVLESHPLKNMNSFQVWNLWAVMPISILAYSLTFLILYHLHYTTFHVYSFLKLHRCRWTNE